MEIEGQVCRTCLKADAKLVPLDVKFENELQGKKMLEFLIGTDVLDCEAFSGICEPCKSTLTVSCNFKQQCMVSNEKIIEYLLEKERNHNAKEENSSLKDPLSDDDDEIPAELVVKEEYDVLSAPNEGTGHFELPPLDPLELPQSSGGIDAAKGDEEEIKLRRSSRVVEMKCNICQLDFQNVAAYQKHYIRKHLITKNKRRLKGHSLQSSAKKTEKKIKPRRPISVEKNCRICQLRFPNIEEYYKHYKSTHKIRKIKKPRIFPSRILRPENERHKRCDLCARSFVGISSYQDHFNSEHMAISEKRSRPSNVLNGLAGDKTQSNSDTDNPEQEEEGSKTTEFPVRPQKPKCCRECDISFPNAREYYVHYKEEHGHLGPYRRKRKGLVISKKEKVACEICGKCVSRTSIASHHLVHVKKNTCFCALCGRGFKAKKYLEIHMKIHTQEKNYTCKYCEMSFVHSHTLKAHILKLHETHKQSKEVFQCTICDKKLKRKHYMECHMRRHRRDFQHECPTCQKKFITNYALKEHMVTHTGEKNYICTVCGKGFGTKSTLNVHMPIHTGERNYVCDVCDKSFTQSHVLRTHYRVAHPEHPAPPVGTLLKKNSKRNY
ncbi:zinc finger protein 226-like [Lutzomyia longipalpis]|uniref:zinc finger protein 226-like n=1 Tax=Lutzomyia longipalpis TaxID=7200 RepID=UPI00248337FE|nr:zinc finger protein 226-like [Lutzomyia longipalpis]